MGSPSYPCYYFCHIYVTISYVFYSVSYEIIEKPKNNNIFYGFDTNIMYTVASVPKLIQCTTENIYDYDMGLK